MELDAAVDHGPIVAQSIFPLHPGITIDELTEQSAREGIELLEQSIDQYLSGEALPFAQDHPLATQTHK